MRSPEFKSLGVSFACLMLSVMMAAIGVLILVVGNSVPADPIATGIAVLIGAVGWHLYAWRLRP